MSTGSAYELGPALTCHSRPPLWVWALPSRHSVFYSLLCPVSWDAGLWGPHLQGPLTLGLRFGCGQREVRPAAREGRRRVRSSTSLLGFLPAGGQRLAWSLLSHSPCQKTLSKASATHGFPRPFLPTPSGRGGNAGRWVLCHPVLISPDCPRTPVKCVCIQFSWGCPDRSCLQPVPRLLQFAPPAEPTIQFVG